jgi:hypothetical protein
MISKLLAWIVLALSLVGVVLGLVAVFGGKALGPGLPAQLVMWGLVPLVAVATLVSLALLAVGGRAS